MYLRRSLGLAVAAALAMRAGAGFTQPAPTVQVNAPRSSKRQFRSTWATSSGSFYGTRGAGITMAQQKRAARKARHVRRHKQNVRGRA